MRALRTRGADGSRLTPMMLQHHIDCGMSVKDIALHYYLPDSLIEWLLWRWPVRKKFEPEQVDLIIG